MRCDQLSNKPHALTPIEIINLNFNVNDLPPIKWAYKVANQGEAAIFLNHYFSTFEMINSFELGRNLLE